MSTTNQTFFLIMLSQANGAPLMAHGAANPSGFRLGLTFSDKGRAKAFIVDIGRYFSDLFIVTFCRELSASQLKDKLTNEHVFPLANPVFQPFLDSDLNVQFSIVEEDEAAQPQLK